MSGDSEIIPADRGLAKKVNSGRGLTREQVIDRGGATLDRAQKNFAGWLGEDVERLRRAADARRTVDGDAAASERALHIAAVDLKGTAATYGYPLISRYADLLCDFLHKSTLEGERRTQAIGAFAHGILTVHRFDIRSDQSLVTHELTETLLALNAKYAT